MSYNSAANNNTVQPKQVKNQNKHKFKKASIKDEFNDSSASIEYLFTEAFISNEDFTAFKDSNTEATIHKWNASYWERIELLDAKALALDWIKQEGYLAAFNDKKAKECIKTLATAYKNTVQPLSNDRTIIPLKNYWLELEKDLSISCYKPNKEIDIRYALNLDVQEEKIIDGKYVPATTLKDSKFKSFLDSSMPNPENQKTLQEYLGYTLVSHCNLQTSLFCIGEGSNGKGVFFEIAAALHNKNKVKSIDITNLNGFKLSPLVEASLIIVPEVGKSFNEEMFKSIIAGDPIQIDRKHREEITFKPIAKWLVSANSMPQIKDQTDGTSRRILILNWKQQFLGDTKIIGLAQQIIDEELDIVLDWAIQGLIEIYKRPKQFIFVSDEAKSEKEEIIQNTDPVRRFVEFSCLEIFDESLGRDKFSLKSQIYKDFIQFCDENFIVGVCGEVKFWRDINSILKNSGHKLTEVKKDFIKDGVKKRVRALNVRYQIPKYEDYKKFTDEKFGIVTS